MIQAENLKLISGNFSADEASRILFELVNSKINFHNMEIAHIQETGVGSIEKSELRLKELKKLKNEIKDLMKEAKQEGVSLNIESTININMMESASTNEKSRF